MYACVMGNPLRNNSSAVIAWWMLCFHSCPIHSGVKALIWSLDSQILLASAYPVCPVALYSTLWQVSLVCFIIILCVCVYVCVKLHLSFSLCHHLVRSLLQAFTHPKIHLVLAWPEYFQVCPVTV